MWTLKKSLREILKAKGEEVLVQGAGKVWYETSTATIISASSNEEINENCVNLELGVDKVSSKHKNYMV